MMQELSLNILDVAQNSVKAGSTLTTVTVEEDVTLDRMVITIADNGCGMDEQQLAHVTDPFYTTRTTRRVGLGVPFFKMAAELTGGSFEISSCVGKGTTVIASFVLSSVDRMPLGDIAATMTSLIQCNPNVDFVYLRRINGREMIADTREFRTALEGVPLDTPEVLAFIADYINQNTGELTIEGGNSI